jgi:hypothetical protein
VAPLSADYANVSAALRISLHGGLFRIVVVVVDSAHSLMTKARPVSQQPNE